MATLNSANGSRWTKVHREFAGGGSTLKFCDLFASQVEPAGNV